MKDQTIADAMDEIQHAISYDNNNPDPGYWDEPTTTTALLNQSNEDLGALLREYVTESVHNDWDGHPEDFREAYYELFADMIRYKINQ
jgi:hypothetical protein